MAFLEIDNLKKRFGSVEILKGINIDLDKVGFLVLVDTSGCGKSTQRHPHTSLERITRDAIGSARVRNPSRFLLDDPLSTLDAKLRVDMRVEIKRLHATTGTTIVYVTHDQIEAMTLATKIAVLKDGELQQVGTPAEIYNNPTNLFVADFMGSPAMNLIPATIGTNGNALSVVL